MTLNAGLRPVADVPHNLVRQTEGGYVHYKGAAAVNAGQIAPLAGSRATLSYVVRATGADPGALGGISHGAGRKYDRATMHGRVGRTRSDRDSLLRNTWGGIAICDDRSLVIEEAASAYKDSARVVADLEAAGLIDTLAAMRPLVTYKKAIDPDDARGADKKDHRGMGRQRNGRY